MISPPFYIIAIKFLKKKTITLAYDKIVKKYITHICVKADSRIN